MEHRGMSHVTGHKDTHAEAEAAKAAHVRPQDRDVPINDDDIKEGEVVHFRDHEKHDVRGIVSRKLGRGDAMLGSNLNTADGRGTHGHEMLYEVLNEQSGTTHTLQRHDISREPFAYGHQDITGSAGSGAGGTAGVGAGEAVQGHHPEAGAPYVMQSGRSMYDGKLGALETQHKGPRRA